MSTLSNAVTLGVDADPPAGEFGEVSVLRFSMLILQIRNRLLEIRRSLKPFLHIGCG